MSTQTFNYDGETITVGSDHWKDIVLSVDPFEGDFGDGPNLSDKIVKTRNTKQLCSDCLSICQPGTYSRAIVANVDGQLLTNRYCEDCCTAMGFDELHQDYQQHDMYADDVDEDYEEVMLSEVRYELRNKNEKILIKELGNRYFEASDEKRYAVMLKHSI